MHTTARCIATGLLLTRAPPFAAAHIQVRSSCSREPFGGTGEGPGLWLPQDIKALEKQEAEAAVHSSRARVSHMVTGDNPFLRNAWNDWLGRALVAP